MALIVVSAAQVLAMAQAGGDFAAFLVAGVLSRFAMLVLLVWLPPARADGMGRLAAGRAGAALVPGAVLGVALMLFSGGAGLPALVAGGLAAGFVGLSAKRRLGGQTGDVLGAAQILSETAIWLVLAARAL